MEVAGWSGDAAIWAVSNGAGASISTSLDGISWKNVGSLPSNLNATTLPVKVARTKAKFLKFESKNLLGLGYLYIKKMK
jgi:hypothetical protein